MRTEALAGNTTGLKLESFAARTRSSYRRPTSPKIRSAAIRLTKTTLGVCFGYLGSGFRCERSRAYDWSADQGTPDVFSSTTRMRTATPLAPAASVLWLIQPYQPSSSPRKKVVSALAGLAGSGRLGS